MRGLASSGPLKNVEIDFLKIDLINFFSDTTFLLLNLFVLIKWGCLKKTWGQSVKIWPSYELFCCDTIFSQIFGRNWKIWFLGLFLSNFKKIHISGQKYVSLNILWITFMILGLKHNIIAGGQFDSPPGLIRWSLNVG